MGPPGAEPGERSAVGHGGGLDADGGGHACPTGSSLGPRNSCLLRAASIRFSSTPCSLSAGMDLIRKQHLGNCLARSTRLRESYRFPPVSRAVLVGSLCGLTSYACNN